MAKSVELGACIARNGGTGTFLNPNDNYRKWLILKGGTGKSIRDLEKSMFAANGGTGKSYSELKGTFCAAKGYSGGRSVEDNWRRFLLGGTV